MTDAYSILHRNGWAHSVEVWSEGDLCGGLYGLAIGKAFFGESMFSRHSNASKAAMTALCQLLSEAGFAVLDCQVESPHLLGLGARLCCLRLANRNLSSSRFLQDGSKLLILIAKQGLSHCNKPHVSAQCASLSNQ